MSKPYRAGIVGAGGVAGLGILGMHDEADIGRRKFRASHAGGYDAVEGIELVAVADVDPDRLGTFCDAWEIPPADRYTDHREMLAAEELDVVSVCTPTLYHRDPVVDAAGAGVDLVWCEKPIACSVADAEVMIDACREGGTELVVNHSLRFTRKLQKLRELLDEGLIGEVRSATATFRMELMRNSTHLLDTLVYLLDARAERVAGYVTGENEAVDALSAGRRVDDAGGGGFVVLDDGTFVTVDCTLPRRISSMSYGLVGTGGKLYLNNDDGEWRYWRLDDGEHVEADLPGIDAAWSWEADYEEAFPNAVAHVVDVLDGDADNASTGEEAARSLEIIVGFYVSEYTGSQVGIPLAGPLRDVTVTSW